MTFSFPKIISLCVLLCAAHTATATESLYDPGSAKPATASFKAVLGPESGSIKYDQRMLKAAKIAEDRAKAKSTARCWRYVKKALLAANLVESYPGTTYAKQAGEELRKNHGFTKINVTTPAAAPVGAVLVYGGKGAGHVEIRTEDGYVSDFESKKPSPRPLIGVYVKPVEAG